MNRNAYIDDSIEFLRHRIANMSQVEYDSIAASIETLGLGGPTVEEYFQAVNQSYRSVGISRTEAFDDNAFATMFNNIIGPVEMGGEGQDDLHPIQISNRYDSSCSGVNPLDCTFPMAA